MAFPLGVEATAFVAAACRAEIDPFARLFASGLDPALRPLVASGREEVAARTRMIDLLLLKVLPGRPDWTVINLGAGLCCRPYRLDLTACREVIEIDSAAIIDIKGILAGYEASCPVRRLPGDVRALPELAAPAIVITEGLLVYLTETELRALATRLAALPGPVVWLADVVSRESAEAMGAIAGAGLKLSGLDSLEVFESAGWEVTDYRPLLISRRFSAPRTSHSVVDGVIELTKRH
jgi:O-methyltransferase involved in polyketide biosynthesis